MLIIDRFEKIVDLKKDKIALVDSEKQITFYELRDKAKILAKKINFILKKTNKPIMVEVDRKVETIISFLAVLYSGNFYVPVNNKDPQNRILEIKEKLGSEIGIFHKKNIFDG
ncbi:MAG: AMP-binding protein, partial [Peptoniphilus harei]|nr:AMP-binding protein [Peptoniphilus harei]